MSSQTILIVDDISDNVDILVELLEEHDLVTALDGKSALKIVETEDIDLILLDIMMPEMDGFEVCQKLKENPKYAKIPIIFLSAKQDKEDIEKGFFLGAVDYVTKPFHPWELLARVQTHLELYAYQKSLKKQVDEAVKIDKIKQQTIYVQAKQAALGEQLTYISHQWKQPLATLSSLNILQRSKIESGIGIEKEEYFSILDKQENQIHFMAQTINTFKNFYNTPKEEEEFYLHEAVEQVLEISDATLMYHHVSVIKHFGDTQISNVAKNELMQALFSIINNAIKIFEVRDVQHPKILFTVKDMTVSILDNGGGIDADVIETLFEPFVSGTEGSGVGLYIAKEMVEKNGGVITAKNTQDGAEFSIEFLTWES